MSEKFSTIRQVIGSMSEDDKRLVVEHMSNQFIHQDEGKNEYADFGVEREKTPEELQIIELINIETNKLLDKYGRQPFDIPTQKVHIVDKEHWPKEYNHDVVSVFNLYGQFTAVKAEHASDRLEFASLVYHEVLHLKSHLALEAEKTTEEDGTHIKFRGYRAGISIHDRQDGSKVFLRNINEAIVEELDKRFVYDVLYKNDLVKDELLSSNNLKKEYGGWGKIDDDNNYFIKKYPLYDDKTYPKAIGFGYETERLVLNSLIDKIYSANQDKFQNREEVFDVFAKAMFDGNILPIGRLLDKTFDDGTFTKLSHITETQELKIFVDAL